MIIQFLERHDAIHEEVTHTPADLTSRDAPDILKQVDGVIEPNQTISEILAGHGISGAEGQEIIDCARPDYNLAKIKAGYAYHILFDGNGRFRDFQYPIDSDQYLHVYLNTEEDRLVSEIKPFPFETRVEKVSQTINSSLFESVLEIGEKDMLAQYLEEIFNSDVDFLIDIRKGDSFKAIVEKKYLEGEFVKYGVIWAASFINDGREIMGFLFEDKNGNPAYYDPEGKALKKSFLKSPLKYTRISSGFSYSRRHPITKKVQPHLGIDYAAPVGTSVRAVANGKVIAAGSDGANGKMVHLQHPKGYETLYLHLSRIVVKRNANVSQGQLIGYVGSSGLSTGPHLDFRIRRYDKPLNPTKMIFPPGDPVQPEQFEQFIEVRDTWMDQLISE
jgi:murein DD-endopeptidase MepM/ murein hydrolase activator NlpD